MKVVKHWNTLCREVVNAPFLETFKVKFDRAHLVEGVPARYKRVGLAGL